jgi:hypothetical protein
VTDRSELAERIKNAIAWGTYCGKPSQTRALLIECSEALLRDSAPALPSEEEIAWALCCGPKQGHCNASVHADGISPDAYAARNCEGEEIRKQARAVLTLLAKSKGCT